MKNNCNECTAFFLVGQKIPWLPFLSAFVVVAAVLAYLWLGLPDYKQTPGETPGILVATRKNYHV